MPLWATSGRGQQCRNKEKAVSEEARDTHSHYQDSAPELAKTPSPPSPEFLIPPFLACTTILMQSRAFSLIPHLYFMGLQLPDPPIPGPYPTFQPQQSLPQSTLTTESLRPKPYSLLYPQRAPISGWGEPLPFQHVTDAWQQASALLTWLLGPGGGRVGGRERGK